MSGPVDQMRLAAQFLTRLPVTVDDAGSDAMAAATRFYPAVGVLIGAISGLVWLVAEALLPGLAAALVTLAAALLLTGALHEDGLADVADGFGATADRDRALEIMRDSRIGSYGTLALILSIGLKAALLGAMGGLLGAAALMAAHAASRHAMVELMDSDRYVRAEGAGGFLRNGIPLDAVAGARAIAALALLPLLIFGGLWALIVALLAAMAAHFAWRAVLRSRLEGYTGDGLGALQQLVEAGVLLGVALAV